MRDARNPGDPGRGQAVEVAVRRGVVRLDQVDALAAQQRAPPRLRLAEHQQALPREPTGLPPMLLLPLDVSGQDANTLGTQPLHERVRLIEEYHGNVPLPIEESREEDAPPAGRCRR